MNETLKLSTFWRLLVFQPRTCFEQYLLQEEQKPYRRESVMAICCYIALRLTFWKAAFSMPINALGVSASVVILLMICAVLPVGLYLAGWLVKLLAWVLGGRLTARQGRKIVLYAFAAVALVKALLLAAGLLFLSGPSLFLFGATVEWIVGYYTLYLYHGALRILANSRPKRTFSFVILLGGCLYTLSMLVVMLTEAA